MNKILNNNKGQMTIFIALIFQVLFVFFAMIINVGLIVHDKINLQNSVDLAAYYGAQRQAEMLNAIAHHNYQIRQAWKLLSFRLRVLGDMGYVRHPIQSTASSFSDTEYTGATPVVCVGHDLWADGQNLCNTSSIVIPQIPNATLVPGASIFVPFNIGVANQIGNLQGAGGNDCRRVSINNFQVAARWALAYRTQVAYSKKAIRTYAQRLSAQQDNFSDIRGESVSEGALKTLSYNMTQPNREALIKDQRFVFFNSLGGMNTRDWLYEVPTYPLIQYARMTIPPGIACAGEAHSINEAAVSSAGAPENFTMTDEYIVAVSEPPTGDLMSSTFGVEKNPWAMAYVGVYAETRPRKPYLPFGEPIVIKAKAFAKPFGGRIGPWYYSTWPRSSNKSAGTVKVDNLAPEPVDLSAAASLSPTQKASLVPNYSRYPGDQLGLKSNAALTVFKREIRQRSTAAQPLRLDFYSATPKVADGLAYSTEASSNSLGLKLGYSGPWIRDVEAAAIAPDLFDATYYSVDIDANANYIQNAIQAGYVTAQEAAYDQGSYLPQQRIVGIKKQMEVLYQLTNAQERLFYIKQPEHLLTAWAPSNAYAYEFPDDVFGKCTFEGDLPVPGRCAAGGRVGYSVKIVSEEYLRSTDLELGGPGQKGPILIQPPTF